MVKISTLPATNQEFAFFTKRHRSFPALAGTTVCPAQIQVKKKKKSQIQVISLQNSHIFYLALFI